MTATQYNITAASRIAGISRNTLKSHMAAGKVSYVKNDAGEKLIDGAELVRVYGNDLNFGQTDPSTPLATARAAAVSPLGSQVSAIELASLQKQLDIINEERQREREQLQERIDHLQKSLESALDGNKRMTLLLEHHQGGGEWEKQLRGLEARLANQEKSHKEFEEFKLKSRQQLHRYKQALEQERKKTVWQKLFG
jgi:hypothetical protein